MKKIKKFLTIKKIIILLLLVLIIFLISLLFKGEEKVNDTPPVTPPIIPPAEITIDDIDYSINVTHKKNLLGSISFSFTIEDKDEYCDQGLVLNISQYDSFSTDFITQVKKVDDCTKTFTDETHKASAGEMYLDFQITYKDEVRSVHKEDFNILEQGNGIETPYYVTSLNTLKSSSAYSHVILLDDIDVVNNISTPSNNFDGFEIFGVNKIFDGNNYSINFNTLSVPPVDSSGSGISNAGFVSENKGIIKNLTLNVDSISLPGTSYNTFGGLVGNNSGTIVKSSFTGTITSRLSPSVNDYYLGGLVGLNNKGGVIEDSFSDGFINLEFGDSITQISIGGLVGNSNGGDNSTSTKDSTIKNSIANMNISVSGHNLNSSTTIGGFVGRVQNSIISNNVTLASEIIIDSTDTMYTPMYGLFTGKNNGGVPSTYDNNHYYNTSSDDIIIDGDGDRLIYSTPIANGVTSINSNQTRDESFYTDTVNFDNSIWDFSLVANLQFLHK